MTLNRVRIPSPNYSGRGGSAVTTIVLHTAEGARTYQELGNFFANPSSGVSSHVGIDDTGNTVGEYVGRDSKAWTAANANPWCVQAELCAFAAWGPGDWDAHPVMLENTAAWIAEEAAVYGIPLEWLSAGDAQNPHVKGVCQHNDLGSMGGGHWDCGPDFPMQRVLDMARGGVSPAPGPEPEPDVEDEVALTIAIADDQSDAGRWYVTDLYSYKTYIPSAEAAAQIIWCTVAAGGHIYASAGNGPIEVSGALLANIPGGTR